MEGGASGAILGAGKRTGRTRDGGAGGATRRRVKRIQGKKKAGAEAPAFMFAII
jgi:hypothetical protein